MRRVALVAMVLTSACGARTGLETPAPDATPRPRFDAGIFTTFPCRWTLGLSTEIARGDAWTELTGAVHPTLDQAAVLATDTRTLERRGATVSIAAAGGVVRPLDPAGALRGPLFTSLTGYARQVDCA